MNMMDRISYLWRIIVVLLGLLLEAGVMFGLCVGSSLPRRLLVVVFPVDWSVRGWNHSRSRQPST